ncbi:hypothetical protein C0V75_09810 [Tabrizicola sp. TH137]|uniref:hypothetical protein n=1 Tax=Tabrizicola sp. TH137 TaxID=2067452 RepID=UPI000C7D6B47|nr:hypothetical protein [Tabrizicola sp. TH137]PLL13643.1 hypothetical protein C0V75_09810 [Tabrizicola sp. TH137]
MMRPILTLALAFALAPSLAPADTARGAAAPCVEVVTFRLVPGTDPAVFITAARATEQPLRGQPGFLRRRLVLGADGQWTDWVEWRDAASAQRAAEAMMAEPAFGPFMALIDGASVVMRHDVLSFAMD